MTREVLIIEDIDLGFSLQAQKEICNAKGLDYKIIQSEDFGKKILFIPMLYGQDDYLLPEYDESCAEHDIDIYLETKTKVLEDKDVLQVIRNLGQKAFDVAMDYEIQKIDNDDGYVTFEDNMFVIGKNLRVPKKDAMSIVEEYSSNYTIE